MAGRADFLVDLEAALKLPFVIFAEGTGERPLHGRRRNLMFLRGGRQRERGKRACQHKSEDGVFGRHDSFPAHAFAPKTESEIEFGNGLVFSKMPSSGRTIRKKAK